MTTREGFRADRLRLGEWIVGIASLALMVDVLALPWYGLTSTFRATSASLGAPTSATGLQAHHLLAPLVLVTCVLGLSVWWAQAVCRSPAIPVCLTVFTAVFSGIIAICLFVRVVFDPPAVLLQGAPGVNTVETLVPAVLGVFLLLGVVVGLWLSLRADGVAAADTPRQIETLALRRST